MSKYIEKVEDVQFEDLIVDTQLRMGQTRPVDEQHVQALVQEFEVNPPHMLELTTWLDQSVLPCFTAL